MANQSQSVAASRCLESARCGQYTPKMFPRRVTLSVSLFALVDATPDNPRGFVSVQFPTQFDGRKTSVKALQSLAIAQLGEDVWNNAYSVRAMIVGLSGIAIYDGFIDPLSREFEKQSIADHSAAIRDDMTEPFAESLPQQVPYDSDAELNALLCRSFG